LLKTELLLLQLVGQMQKTKGYQIDKISLQSTSTVLLEFRHAIFILM
jgi:hypothetical protein